MILALCVGLLSSSFAADLKPVGKAEISAQVDVPLYAGIDSWDNSYYVEVKVGEKAALLRLVTDNDQLRLTKAGAKALGVAFKGAEGKEKANVDLSLGTVKLSGITATMMGSGQPEFSFDSSPRAMPLMGQIGLAGFAELAYAILPSEGVLRLAPVADGNKLVAALGGTPIEYSSQAAEKFHLGAGPKYEVDNIPYIVNVEWSGAALPTILGFGSRTMLAWEVEQPPAYSLKGHTIPQVTLPAAPSDTRGQQVDQWREVKVGGLSAWLEVPREGMGPTALVEPTAQAGQALLAGVELAVDPTAHKLALRRAPAMKLASYRAIYEASLKKALEPAPAAEGASAPSEADAKKAKVAALRSLAKWYGNLGVATDFLSTSQQIVDADPALCSDWLRLSEAQLLSNHYGEALTAARKASELYEPWMKLSTKERADLQKDYDAAMKAKKDWSDPIPQDAACGAARSREAQALLMQSDYAAIAAIYPSKLDLDYLLAIVAGNSLLLQGKTEEAQAAYQQSITLLRTAAPAARVGLVLTARSWEQAQAQVDGSRGEALLRTLSGMRAYLATATRFGGPDAALKEVERLLANRPGEVGLWLAKANLLKQQGKDNSAALTEAQKQLDAWRLMYPQASGTYVASAELLLLQGKASEAKAQADLAIAANPIDINALIAQADCETALGNAGKAAEYLKRAANSANPADVLLLQNK